MYVCFETMKTKSRLALFINKTIMSKHITICFFKALAEVLHKLEDSSSVQIPVSLQAKIKQDCPRDCEYTR
jgi:hypothetical protein